MKKVTQKGRAIYANQQRHASGSLSIRTAGRQSVSGVTATVFGASGLLGRYAVAKIAQAGGQCIIPYRGDGMNVRHLKIAGDLGQVIPRKCELWDENAIRAAVCRSNVVINCLGQNHETKNYTFDDVNAKCTQQIARICAEFPNIERFVHVSSLGASSDSASLWQQSKAKGEAIVKDYLPNATIIRPGPMYGVEDRYLNWYAQFSQFMPFSIMFNEGKTRTQPIDARDVAQGIVNSLYDTTAPGRTYELGGDKIFAEVEIIDTVLKAILIDQAIVNVRAPFDRWYGNFFQYFLGRWKLATPDKIRLAYEDRLVSTKGDVGTCQDLLVKPASLEEAVMYMLQRHVHRREPVRQAGILNKDKHPEYLPSIPVKSPYRD